MRDGGRASERASERESAPRACHRAAFRRARSRHRAAAARAPDAAQQDDLFAGFGFFSGLQTARMEDSRRTNDLISFLQQ